MKILDQIIQAKHKEVTERQGLYPTKLLEKSIYMDSPCVSLKSYLQRTDLIGVIAEIKRASPSAGMLNQYISVENLSIGYMQAGASALSILTDETFFKGSLADLKTARSSNFCPILRKDFIIDEYQILEARSYGADVILLIAKILTVEDVARLASFAHSLGLEVLLELHDKNELAKYPLELANVIGINARNLDTLEMNSQFVEEAISQLPKSSVAVAESGIKEPKDLMKFKKLGFKGFLIGETFMRAADPAHACQQFIKSAQELCHAE